MTTSLRMKVDEVSVLFIELSMVHTRLLLQIHIEFSVNLLWNYRQKSLVREKKSNDNVGLKLSMKVVCQVMFTSNLDIDNKTINRQIGTVPWIAVLNGQLKQYMFDATAVLK